MARFSIRDLLWLTAVIALGLALVYTKRPNAVGRYQFQGQLLLDTQDGRMWICNHDGVALHFRELAGGPIGPRVASMPLPTAPAPAAPTTSSPTTTLFGGGQIPPGVEIEVGDERPRDYQSPTASGSNEP